MAARRALPVERLLLVLRPGPLGSALWPPGLCMLLALLVLLVGYRAPLALQRDIGSDRSASSGFYANERNPQFSYAYIGAQASLWLPQLGDGPYQLGLRLGGPQGQPVAVTLTAAGRHYALGQPATPRVYRLLLPAQGRAQIVISSTTRQFGSDPRRLGAMLDWADWRAVGMAAPAPLLGWWVLTLALVWASLQQLALRPGRRVLVLLALTLLGSTLLVLARGRFDLPGWWLGTAGLFLCAVVSLARFDGRWSVRPLPGVALMFLGWHAAVYLIAALGVWWSAEIRAFAGSFTYDAIDLVWKLEPHAFTPAGFPARTLYGSWLQWDSFHYRTIAAEGYGVPGSLSPRQAFFPLYPLLIRLLAPLTGGDMGWSSLLISHAALFAALLLLYDLLARDFDSALAYRALLLLLVFPTAFFFAAGLTESLALLLLVATLWAVRRERWWLAGLCGALLALTRLPGVLATPLIGLAYLQACGWRWRALRPALLAALLPLLALAGHALFLGWRYSSPLAFLEAQRFWQGATSPPWVIPQEIYRLYVLGAPKQLMIFDAAVWALFLVLTVLVLWRLPLLYGMAVLAMLLPPYLNNRALSLPRYVLLAFPVFVLLAHWGARLWVRRVMLALALPLLVGCLILFVNALWVG